MPSCICGACNHQNSVSCAQCTCCSYRRFACLQKETSSVATPPKK